MADKEYSVFGRCCFCSNSQNLWYFLGGESHERSLVNRWNHQHLFLRNQCSAVNSYRLQTVHDQNFKAFDWKIYVSCDSFFSRLSILQQTQFIRNQLHTGFHSGLPKIIRTADSIRTKFRGKFRNSFSCIIFCVCCRWRCCCYKSFMLVLPSWRTWDLSQAKRV